MKRIQTVGVGLAGCVLAVAALLGGCVSATSVESKPADMPANTDAFRKAQIHTELSAGYFSRGQFAVALDEARMALRDYPNHVQAYNMLALIYGELREDAQAVTAYEQALRLAPGDSDVLNNYGWFMCQRGDPQRALGLFQAALRNPLYTTPQRAYLNAGFCARRMGNDTEAERNFRMALDIEPTLSPALFNLADIAYARAQYKDAEVYLARHARVEPSPTADALLLAVRISRALGDKGNEDSYLQQLKRRFPDAPQTLQAGSGR